LTDQDEVKHSPLSFHLSELPFTTFPFQLSYFNPLILNLRAQHNNMDHDFPEEAEQNEIGGPVLVSFIILITIVLVIWGMS